MRIAENCQVMTGLFFGALGLAVLGNVLGVAAWRKRAADQRRWRWLVDPTYLLRGANFENPRDPARFGAIGLLVLGLACLLALVAAVISAQRAGATSICGFNL